MRITRIMMIRIVAKILNKIIATNFLIHLVFVLQNMKVKPLEWYPPIALLIVGEI